MKTTYLIAGGIGLVVLLLATWVYLLIYGTPKPVENFFTDFSFGSNAESIELPQVAPPVDSQVNITDVAPLRQLTTRPVVGFGEHMSGEGTTTSLRYVEAGTGHVYAIDLITGNETRLSNITITNPQTAKFSVDGLSVAIRSGFGTQNTIELITLTGESNTTRETLTNRMLDYTFNADGKLLYTEYSQNGLTARSLDTATGNNSVLFTIPFQSTNIIWDTTGANNHFFYPKPSAKLPGYLYRVLNNATLRELPQGNGLLALANDDFIVYTITTTQGPISYGFNRANTTKIDPLPVIMQPEKCLFSKQDSNLLYCAATETPLTYEFPDNWYKGLIALSDKLYEIDITKGQAAQLSNPKTDIGREIDVIDMTQGRTGEVLYFINKNDNTLWLYEI